MAIRMSYTTTVQFRARFRLFAALSLVTNGMLAALMLAFVLAGAVNSSPASAATIPAASSGTHEQAAMGELERLRTADPRVPDRLAECFEIHHSCAPSALLPSHAGALSPDLAPHVGFVTPRAPERVAVPGVAPHPAASLSILFRNFRK